jgi:hypothetical protein
VVLACVTHSSALLVCAPRASSTAVDELASLTDVDHLWWHLLFVNHSGEAV